MDRLAGALGNTELLHCWVHILQNTDALLLSPWGRSTVHVRSGIRQGATESPAMFTAIMQWVVSKVAAEHRWHEEQCFDDLGIEQASYMDDAVLWAKGVDTMERRLNQLADALAEWGLELNIEKCQLYISPHCTQHRPVYVRGVRLAPDSHVTVMGLPLLDNALPTPLGDL